MTFGMTSRRAFRSLFRALEERWMRRFAWAMLGLGLWVLDGGVEPAAGQDPQPTIELQHNRFNPVTTIPFTLRGTMFLKGHRPGVSLRVYNLPPQLVPNSVPPGT